MKVFIVCKLWVRVYVGTHCLIKTSCFVKLKKALKHTFVYILRSIRINNVEIRQRWVQRIERLELNSESCVIRYVDTPIGRACSFVWTLDAYISSPSLVTNIRSYLNFTHPYESKKVCISIWYSHLLVCLHLMGYHIYMWYPLPLACDHIACIPLCRIIYYRVAVYSTTYNCIVPQNALPLYAILWDTLRPVHFVVAQHSSIRLQ